MHIVNCEHPLTIYNKYINRTVIVSCNKCKTCRNQRNLRWVQRLQDEKKCWKYCFELYLDYNDDYLPSFDFGPDGDIIERQSRFYDIKDDSVITSLPLDFIDELSQFDKDYVLDRLNDHYTGLAHPSVRDIQLFKKRLNKYVRQLTGDYRTFRSAIAAEIGPTTFRPHYHGILYFNDSRISEHINMLCRKAWQDGAGHQLGHCYARPDRGGVCSYVASYIVRPSDLPALYSLSAFRPFFLSSRHPPIGSLFESTKEVQEIFRSASPQRLAFKVERNVTVPTLAPLQSVTENRLFPKCPSYSEIDDSCRRLLYSCGFSSRGLISDYDEFLEAILMRICQDPLSLGDGFPTSVTQLRPSVFSDLILHITHNFETDNSLRLLHSQIKRIYYQAEIFGVSYYQYVSKILEYYNNKELLKLKVFYDWQSSYPYDKDDLLSAYEFRTPPGTYKSTRDYKIFIREQRYKYDKSIKTMEKNAYFESLKKSPRDSSLYCLINKYHYAKKCNETVEA